MNLVTITIRVPATVSLFSFSPNISDDSHESSTSSVKKKN